MTMTMTNKERQRLKKCLAAWKTRQIEYETASNKLRKEAEAYAPSDSLLARRCLMDANRYEGVATATRWAIEDLRNEKAKVS